MVESIPEENGDTRRLRRSFESHFFGALLGVLLAFLLKRRDPPSPRRKYSWETEADIAEEEDDPGPRGGNQ